MFCLHNTSINVINSIVINTNTIDNLDDLHALSLISIVIMMSMNLIFNTNIVQSFKTYFIRYARASASAITCELGSKSKNYYRMSNIIFWKSYDILKDDMNKKNANISHRCHKKRRKKFILNRIIHSLLYLSIALRYFAGECLLDILLVHGVSPSEVQFSIWKVVDAAHQNQDLKIEYPSCYKQQKQITYDFSKISYAGFENCGGCIDSLLIWINKLNEKDSTVSEVGIKKFYSWRKYKFGLNM